MSVKGNIAAHMDLISRDDFQRAIDHALMEYQLRVAANTDTNTAGAGHFKSVGAVEFVATLKTLAIQPAALKFAASPSIDHTA